MNVQCNRLLLFFVVSIFSTTIVEGLLLSDPYTTASSRHHHHSWRSSRIIHPPRVIRFKTTTVRTTTTTTTATLLPTGNAAIVRVKNSGPNERFGGTSTSTSRLQAVPYNNNNDVDDDDDDTDQLSNTVWKVLVKDDPKRAVLFSLLMTSCGAVLGPFLDAYHSAFGVLQYDKPIIWILWGSEHHPALTTAWWVPELFGLAGFLIGWLYILFDTVLLDDTSSSSTSPATATATATATTIEQKSPTPPKILLGIALFTFQYWLSGILFESNIIDRTGILNLMSIISGMGFLFLDGSMSGLFTSLATCIGGPVIEIGLITATTSGILSGGGGYHYTDLGETGYFPLWIVPVYFLGGPANGNLARGFWNALSSTSSLSGQSDPTKKKGQVVHDNDNKTDPCPVCQDTRRVECPNCDGVGTYVAMGGRTVRCTSCNGRGFVMCRACFDRYEEDPYDIDTIRDIMNRMPD
jgi:hypothetical protein